MSSSMPQGLTPEELEEALAGAAAVARAAGLILEAPPTRCRYSALVPDKVESYSTHARCGAYCCVTFASDAPVQCNPATHTLNPQYKHVLQ